MGRTIKLYLVDGTAQGILTSEIFNWTGKVFVVPRNKLDDFIRRPDVKRTGVYILVEEDLDSSQRRKIYVGETDEMIQRLVTHASDVVKDFWDFIIVLVSKDENLTKAHAKYLECRLIENATKAERATLTNQMTPNDPSLPESDISDMDDFLEQFQLLLPALGFSFLQPKSMVSEHLVNITPSSVELSLFRCLAPKGEYDARAQEVGSSFVVLKGSKFRSVELPSLSRASKNFREQLRQDQKLRPNGDHLELMEDVKFSSPSAAADAVYGISVNSRDYWKLEESGKTYRELYQERLLIAAQAVGINT